MSTMRARSLALVLLACLAVGGTTPAIAGPSADSAGTARGAAGPAPEFQWAWITARNPSVGGTPNAMDRGNSSGGVNTYVRNDPGDWTVTLTGLDDTPGVAFVTPFRTDRLCSVHSYGYFAFSLTVRVICVDEAFVKRDSRFSLVYLEGISGSSELGHLWADHPGDTTYTADSYEYNSTGELNRVRVLGTGRWKVRFNGLGDPGGHIQITVSSGTFYGQPYYCQVEGFGSNRADDELSTVACYDADGDPVDTKFFAAFMRDVGFKGDGGSRVAYAWADQLSAAAPYSPPANRSFNPGGDITVERTGEGTYRVELEGQQRGGAALVTPYGTNAHRCAVTGIRTSTPQRISVACVDPDGDPADTRFLLSYVK